MRRDFYKSGVLIPKKYKWENYKEWDPKELIKEKDVDVRRELIKRYGLLNLYKHLLNKVIHKQQKRVPLVKVVHKDRCVSQKFTSTTKEGFNVCTCTPENSITGYQDLSYSLLSLKLDDTDDLRDCRFLQMVNPSTEEIHIEGVHPSCKTVQEAINFRAGGEKWDPEIIT